MSDAIESQGFFFKIADGGSPFLEVKEVVSFQGFDGQASEIDVTHLQSTAKEFLIGLQDFGNFNIDVNYLPEDPGQIVMRTAKATRERQSFECTFSDGSKATFQGFVMSNPVSGGVDGKIDSSFNVRITGSVTFTAAP